MEGQCEMIYVCVCVMFIVKAEVIINILINSSSHKKHNQLVDRQEGAGQANPWQTPPHYPQGLGLAGSGQ